MNSRPPSAPGASRAIDAILWISSALAAILLGGVIWLHVRVTEVRERLQQEIGHADEMVKIRNEILHLHAVSPGLGDAPEGSGGVSGFLESRAKGLGSITITPDQRGTLYKDWKETHKWVMEIKGSKDAPVNRKNLVTFLEQVQRERPSLKIRHLDKLTFSGEDLTEARITFSGFERVVGGH